MSSSLVARRGATAALAVIATAALFLIGFAPGSASAAAVTKGSVVLTIPSGKAGKVSAVSPAKVTKRFGKKGAKVSAATKGGSFGEKVATGLQAAGALKLANGKRSVKISGLKLAIDRKLAVVRGNVAGKKNIVVFTAAGKGTFSADPATAKFTAGKLKFPASVAKLVKNRLKLKKAPNGRLGTLFVNASRTETDPCVVDPNAPGCNPDPCEANPDAEGCPIVDPYLAQCDVAATSKVTGSLPGAAVLPTLTDPQAISGLSTVSWGIKQSFRSYVTNTAGPGAANGSLHALDGASFGGTEPHNTATDPINWTFVNGTLSENGTPNNPGDDKAIVNLSGTVVFCATGHNFRVAISDPTFVIDEEDSRIIADVDSNLAGVWTRAQRVDLADVSLLGGGSARGFIPDALGTRFENLVVSMTETGGKAICGESDPRCNYTTGTQMDDLDFDAPIGELVDQYNAQCPVDAASREINAWTPASELPNMSGALATTEPTAINWGFKSSFRGYVLNAPPAGSLQAFDGASLTGGPSPAPFTGFSFPVSGGTYKANDAGDNTDDQAVIPGSGTGLFCKSGHFFWASISDPTVVIDGANSRIVATISQNTNGGDPDNAGPWQTPQRVDLADLDISNVTPIYNKSGSEVTWTNIPVSLNENFATYAEDTALDPITVSVKTPYDTGAGDAAAWDALATYVQTNLPFPNSDPVNGGCEVGVPAGGTAPAARTIDEHASYGGTTSAWMPSPNSAAAVPALTGTAVTGGGLDWGFRASLRSSVSGSGQFNLAEGALASTSYYGNGGSLVTFGGYGMNMGAASSYFTWPTSGGTYKANGVGDTDDQLVLRNEGVVGFCQLMSAQRYGIIFSNPTVVIDGANSRLTYEVATRYRLSWIRATVDFAKLDPTQATLASVSDAGTTTKTWTFPGAAVTLTADGNKMARMLNSAYVENLALDGATIRASFPE